MLEVVGQHGLERSPGKVSLEALGARDQACATFSETIRKFPDADAELKAALGRARARANCA